MGPVVGAGRSGGSMHLIVDGEAMPIVVTETESVVSKSTGRKLTHIDVELCVHGQETHRWVEEALESGTVVLREDPNEADVSFRVVSRSSSYCDANPDEYTYRFELQELEDLFARTVKIGDLEFQPYAYEEEADEELTVHFRTVITSDEQDALFALAGGEYVDVVREGVTERPESMRLGRCLWQREGDRIRQEIVLVHRTYDDTTHSYPLEKLSQPFQSRAQEQLVLLSARMEQLIDALGAAGVLTSDQVAQVTQVPDEALDRYNREFLRVRDLDRFLDD